MSSPNARSTFSLFDRSRIAFHHWGSHFSRIELLASHIARYIPARSRILDLGCGDLKLATRVARSIEASECVGADIWPLRTEPPEGTRYVQIDADQPLPFVDREFDVALLIDTLHHADAREALLREALRVSRRVMVKDHFERSLLDRGKLHLLDWLGNSGYGISTPDRYFTSSEFESLVRSIGGKLEILENEVDLYGRIPILGRLFPPRLHFIASIVRSEHGESGMPDK
jgi:SAM-dependent methyltransferase